MLYNLKQAVINTYKKSDFNYYKNNVLNFTFDYMMRLSLRTQLYISLKKIPDARTEPSLLKHKLYTVCACPLSWATKSPVAISQSNISLSVPKTNYEMQ